VISCNFSSTFTPTSAQGKKKKKEEKKKERKRAGRGGEEERQLDGTSEKESVAAL